MVGNTCIRLYVSHKKIRLNTAIRIEIQNLCYEYDIIKIFLTSYLSGISDTEGERRGRGRI